MRIGTRIIVVAALAAFATLSFGQGRGGFGMFGGGGGLMPSSFLVSRTDVQTDLKLTDDQKTKLLDLQQSSRSKMREIFTNANGDRDKMQADFKTFNDEMVKQVNAILTPDQQTRAHQIAIQLAGNGAALDPGVQKDLSLTDDQKTKITALQKTMNDANQSIGEKIRNQEIDRTEAQASMQKNRDTLNTEIGKVLTDDQKASLKKMGGATFTADPPPGG